jgi:hypothetical protein
VFEWRIFLGSVDIKFGLAGRSPIYE